MHDRMNATHVLAGIALFAASLLGAGLAECSAQTPGGLVSNSQAILRLEAVLAAPIELELVETPLPEVVGYLADMTQCTVLIDELGLVDLGLDVNSLALTGTFRDLSLSSALHHLLRPHGLGYGISHEALVITSEDEAATLTYLRCYPVGDLVERWPALTTNSGQDGGAGGGGFFQVGDGMSDMNAGGGYAFPPSAPKIVGDELMELITVCVSSDSWDCNGGEGAIAYAPPSQMLVVEQTYAVHVEVSSLLAQLVQAVDAQPAPGPVGIPDQRSSE